MTRTLAATLRRVNRLMRTVGMTKATRNIQTAMTDLIVKSTMAPLAALTPKVPKPRRVAAPKAGQTLGMTLQKLAASKSLMPVAKPVRATVKGRPRIPKGAQYLDRTHRSAAGSRSYKLYLPASHPKRPKGLILMLHGCNQTPDDFARGTHMNALAEHHGLAIAYAAQTEGQNAASCWNWFKPVNQARGLGEPAILASLTRKLMKDFGLGHEAVFVAGLSAGGAMAAILADVYPDVFSAAGVHSGLARGAARNVVSAISAMRSGSASATMEPVAGRRALPPTRRIIFHGDADSTVHPANAAQIVTAAVGENVLPTRQTQRSARGRRYHKSEFAGSDGAIVLELWMLEGAAHAWSGGRAAGSYTDRTGPDASAQMVRFFLAKSA